MKKILNTFFSIFLEYTWDNYAFIGRLTNQNPAIKKNLNFYCYKTYWVTIAD